MTTVNLGANFAGIIMYSLSHILAQIAVPTFFLISGFLFFKKLEDWNKAEWYRKLRARFSSIIIPYVICISIFSCKHIVSHLINGDLTSWLDSQGGILNLFWASEYWKAGQKNMFGQSIIMSGPAAYHLWFLRDLIVVVLCTPLYYAMFAMKGEKHRNWAIVWLCVLAIVDLTRLQTTIPGISFSTMFYFGLGSFLSLNKIELHNAFFKHRRLLWVAFVMLFFVLIPLDGSRSRIGTLIMPFENLIGVMCLINLTAYFIKGNISFGLFRRYERTSFFMFIIHPFFLAVVWKVLSMLVIHLTGSESITSIEFVNSHPILTLAIFFTKVALAAILSVITYNIITRLSPRLSRIVCGR